MKTFLNSFRNFVFCLKFHLQHSPPPMKFQKFPLPPSFSPPSLFDFEKFQFPLDFVEFKNPVPPLHKGKATMNPDPSF